MNRNYDKDYKNRNKRSKGIVEAVAKTRTVAGEDVAEKVGRNKPQSCNKEDNKDSLNLSNARTETASRNTRNQKEARLRKATKLAVVINFGTHIEGILECFIAIFAQETNEQDVCNDSD